MYLQFSFTSCGLRAAFLLIGELYRESRSGELAALPFGVPSDAAFNIIRYAGVKLAVPALDDIDGPGFFHYDKIVARLPVYSYS